MARRTGTQETSAELVMAAPGTGHDVERVKSDLEGSLAALGKDIEALRHGLVEAIDRQAFLLTVRMGVMIAAATAVLATINRL